MYSFLTGFGTGLALAVLFAPRAGAQSRQFLGTKANEGVGYLMRQTDEVKETTLDAIDRGRDVLLKHVEKIATAQAPRVDVYHR